jgi:hypothetical protein
MSHVRPLRAADLAALATDSMWDALLDLPSGEVIDESVYVFFDVSQAPGREFAASALAHEERITREHALAAVDASAAKAAATGHPVGIGAFFSIDDLVAVLDRYVVDDASRAELVRLEHWLVRPAPVGWCRLVIVCGTELRASLTRVTPHETAAAVALN